MSKPVLPELGFGCWSTPSVSLPELCRITRDAGFRRITMHPYMFDVELAAGRSDEDIRAEVDAAGLEVTMIDAVTEVFPGVPPMSEVDRAILAALPIPCVDAPGQDVGLRAAEALGARSVNVAHFLGTPTPPAEMVDALRQVARRAASLDILVCVEFIPGTGIPDIGGAAELIRACGEPNVAILFDTFHHARSGGTVDEIHALPAGMIGAIQLSDRVAPTAETTRLPFRGRHLPGDGELPLIELISSALQNNPLLTVDLEIINNELSALAPAEAAARIAAAAERWRALFEEVAVG